MDSLFDNMVSAEPLALRMRPETLSDFYGQEAILGPGSFLRAMIAHDTVPSLLLYGPSGTGKTTLASIIAHETKRRFVALNATSTGLAELRAALEEARKQVQVFQKRTILFLDEIHRFNKSQQDTLLPVVEDGTIILIGATTENPFFEVNRPLLSRLRVLQLQALGPKAIVQILQRALCDADKGLGSRRLKAGDAVLESIGVFVSGDGRMALGILEQAASLVDDGGEITADIVEQVVGRRVQTYDKKGNSHYDTISAFIKSMRGSDPQAVSHYLARMIEAGEDPNFIARRIVICAAEDVGLADPQALVVANAAAQAAHMVGFPEARIILSEAAIYVALAPKSNTVYRAIDAALSDVRTKDCGEVPKHLRDAHYGGAKSFGHGVDYKYAHDFPQAYVDQQYLPDPLVDAQYYVAKDNGREGDIVARWEERKK